MLHGLINNEHTEDDVAKFTTVARLRRPVLRLSDATKGELGHSARHRRIYAPAGYSAELRAMFRSRGVCWGRGLWLRTGGEPDFSDAEVDFVASISAHVAHGLRTALLIGSGDPDVAPDDPPGMVVLRDDDTVESLTSEAERWLDEFPDESLELPSIVYQVARRASVLADTGGSGAPARGRVRLRSGRWLLVHGARMHTADGMPAQTAVMLEPARRAELAPLIIEMYELTDREQQITHLLASGKSIGEITQGLFISPHTVRYHVKAIFSKLGVTSRPELTAMLFHEHYLPAIHDGAMKVTGTLS
jgi:DNA-binding CsgD family transcriptional regulator